jgi:uncharacterized protein (DUF2267 family)
MTTATIPALERTVQQTHEWVNSISEKLGRDDPQRAYRALRVTLHVLRDRLPTSEAAHLAAQLPTLVRGIFWEGWRPQDRPTSIRRLDEFVHAVAVQLEDPQLPPQDAIQAVFAELADRVAPGEIAQVRTALPEPLRALWP